MRLTTATRRAFEFGCTTAACAPPNRKGTGGTGGSIKGQAFDRRSRNPKLAPWIPVTGSKPPKGAPAGRGSGAYSNDSPRTIFQPPIKSFRRQRTAKPNKITVSAAIAAAFHKIKEAIDPQTMPSPHPYKPRSGVRIGVYKRAT